MLRSPFKSWSCFFFVFFPSEGSEILAENFQVLLLLFFLILNEGFVPHILNCTDDPADSLHTLLDIHSK